MYWNCKEVEIANKNEHKNKSSSRILYIALFSIFFITSIRTVTYFGINIYYIGYITVKNQSF